MDKYNISEYITIVKRGLVKNNGQGPAGILLLGQMGELIHPRIDFDDAKISRLVKHLNDVNIEIVKAVSNPSYVRSVISSFKCFVARDFNSATIDNVCLNLIN